MADKPADVDPAEFPPEDAETTIDSRPFVAAMAEAAAPTAILDGQTTPHPLRDSAEFMAGIEVGRAEGRASAMAEAEAAAVTEHRKVREDAIETVRALWVIFEIGFPSWPEAEKWIRSRLTPL